MTQLLIYIPNAKNVTDAQLGELGVRDLLPDGASGGWAQRTVHGGPALGSEGVVVGADAKGLGYFPNDQVWHPCADGAYYVGWDRASGGPGPSDLVRDETIEGHDVTLADGRDWTVPIIRSVMHGSALPQQLVLDGDGNWSSRPLEIYAQHEADAERVWQHIMREIGAGADGGESDETAEDAGEPDAEAEDGARLLTDAEVIDIAIRGLAINYRLNKWLVSALGLFDTRTPIRVGQAMIDWPALLELMQNEQKKSSPAGDTSPTDAGVTDSPPATSPPSPT